jgi:hypothetical protein
MLVLSSAEATLDRPTAADVSMTGPVRVEEATVLGGADPRALRGRIRHASVVCGAALLRKKVATKNSQTTFGKSSVCVCRCAR